MDLYIQLNVMPYEMPELRYKNIRQRYVLS